jgi:UDPglucose 6-dehydrogenase
MVELATVPQRDLRTAPAAEPSAPRSGVAIVGFGAVGRSLAILFPDAAVYDPPLGLGRRDEVNRCRFAFVCVPTPATESGECDTSAVEEAAAWIESDYIVIRSTVPPGTTSRLASRFTKRIIFQPEYGPGETPDHPYQDPRAVSWIILGGPRAWTVPVCDLYKTIFSSELSIHQTDAITAELVKYMENAFLATKVAFCNEFYDLAQRDGVDYNELRELWLLDPRIGRSHTWVHPNDRGFGGKCLPKDLQAIVAYAQNRGEPAILLDSVLRSNRRIRRESADQQ